MKCLCGSSLYLQNTCQTDPHIFDIWLRICSKTDCEVCVLWLIEHGANVNAPNPKSGCTPLLVAVREQKCKTVRQLIKCKASVNIKNADGISPLGLIALFEVFSYPEDLHLTKMLLDSGANCNTQNNWLVFALAQGRNKCKAAVVVFMGIRRKSVLTFHCRDTHKIIGEILWKTRFDECWRNP